VVAAASSLIDVTQSREGLGNTGMVLLVGPNRRVSRTEKGERAAINQHLRFILEMFIFYGTDADCTL
jgi:osomolarity two-component system sensor histidine kinase SLN1